MSSRTARSVDRTVDKMFRQMARSSKGVADTNNSSSTAALALERMAEIQKRIARGDTDAAQFLAERVIKQAEAEEPADVRREKLRALKAEKGKAWASPVSIFGTAVCALAIVAYGFSAFSDNGHSVSGKVLVDQQIAADIELVFHSLSRSDIRVKVRTNSNGDFAVESLPAGDYKVLVLPLNGSNKIPKRYASPISTPLRVKLNENMGDLTMSVSSDVNSRKS